MALGYNTILLRALNFETHAFFGTRKYAPINIIAFKITLNTGQHKHDYVSLNNDGDEDNDNNTKSFVQSFWLQIQRSRVRFPALPDFLSSRGSGTGSTQPREIN